MKVEVVGVNNIKEEDVIKGFVLVAEKGLSNKNEILEKLQFIENKVNEYTSLIEEYKEELQYVNDDLFVSDENKMQQFTDKYGSTDELIDLINQNNFERKFWNDMNTRLLKVLETYKNFDKNLCFSNIRELLKQNDEVKIGQIEKEAHVRLGYLSRLEKEGNKSEPSIEFIVSAAKLLKVSVDTLISVDLAGLTPTEKYLVKFFDKLKADTLADKLEWNVESPNLLNNLEVGSYGNCSHPLFSYETFSEESEVGYPEEVSRVTFNSKSYGFRTFINDDCFNLRLKNGATLYLMDISKSVYRTTDTTAFAKEIWMVVPHSSSQYLITTKDNSPIVPLVESLFNLVKERMQHPKVNREVISVIDSFMDDDFEDDPIDGSLF